MSQEWSGMVSAEVKEEYMTLQGRLQDYSVPLYQKLKVISSSFELDINASQACNSEFLIFLFMAFYMLNWILIYKWRILVQNFNYGTLRAI